MVAVIVQDGVGELGHDPGNGAQRLPSLLPVVTSYVDGAGRCSTQRRDELHMLTGLKFILPTVVCVRKLRAPAAADAKKKNARAWQTRQTDPHCMQQKPVVYKRRDGSGAQQILHSTSVNAFVVLR